MTDRNEEAMLALLRAALWGKELPETADAKGVCRELRDHAVAFLPEQMPGDTGERQNAQAWNVAKNMRLGYVQQECLEALESAGIGAVVLKGSAAAIYYPYPEHRTFGDIDILVQDEHFEDAARILAALGNAGTGAGNEAGRHRCYIVEDVPVELHRYFADDPGLDARLKRAIPRARTEELFGTRFSMLPAVENGLVILDHIRRHLIEGQLGLRQVIDWMMFAHAELSDAENFGAFLKEARSYHLETLAVRLTELCRKHLGLPGEAVEAADEAICDELMRCVLESGNFGRKRKAVERDTLLVMNELRAHPFRTLQQAGEKNWEAIRRHGWLRPFAWSYQIFRYLHRGLNRKRVLNGVAGDWAESRRHVKLFRRLGLEGYAKEEKS